MIAALAWLRGHLSAKQPRRTHRVTTVTRTVMRESGEPAEQVQTREEVVNEETLPPDVSTPTASAVHVSVAVTSVAAVVAMAFVFGWVIRRLRESR